MKFAQFGDVHLDAAFERLPASKAAERRAGGRRVLFDVVEAAKREGAQMLFCTGDLFDSGSPYADTLSAVSQAFAGAGFPVFMVAGNHDIFESFSPYNAIKWGENVHIFTSGEPKSVVIEDLGVRVTGVSAVKGDFPLRPLRGHRAPSDGLINILLMHGDVGISDDDVAAAGYDYLAIGHLHTFEAREVGKTLVVRNGSLEAHGFDEPGEKGMVIAEIEGGQASAKLLPLGGCRCVRLSICGDGMPDDELAGRARDMVPYPPVLTLLRLEVTGTQPRDFSYLEHLLSDFLALKLVDSTSPAADIWAREKENSLAGLFLRNLRAKMEGASPEEVRKIEAAAVFGLAALENRDQPSFRNRE